MTLMEYTTVITGQMSLTRCIQQHIYHDIHLYQGPYLLAMDASSGCLLFSLTSWFCLISLHVSIYFVFKGEMVDAMFISRRLFVYLYDKICIKEERNVKKKVLSHVT